MFPLPSEIGGSADIVMHVERVELRCFIPTFRLNFMFQSAVVEYDVDVANPMREEEAVLFTPLCSSLRISIFRRALGNYCLFSSPV